MTSLDFVAQDYFSLLWEHCIELDFWNLDVSVSTDSKQISSCCFNIIIRTNDKYV